MSGVLAERVDEVAWASDSRHLFLVTEDAVTKRANQLWRLDLNAGGPEVVFEETDPLYNIDIARTRDRQYLVVDCQSTDTWESRYLDAADPMGAFKVVVPRQKGHKYVVDHRDGLFYIRTNMGAKNFRVVTAPVATPDPSHWTEFIAHQDDVLLNGINLFEHYAVSAGLRQGLAQFAIYSFTSKTWRQLTFPEAVYAAFAGATPDFTARAFRINYQSFITPSSVYDYDLATGTQTLLKQTEVLGGYDKHQYVTERLWAPARDGVKVPLSVVYKKGLTRDGQAPLLLYGYGSYGIGSLPFFSVPASVSWTAGWSTSSPTYGVVTKWVRRGTTMGC